VVPGPAAGERHRSSATNRGVGRGNQADITRGVQQTLVAADIQVVITTGNGQHCTPWHMRGAGDALIDHRLDGLRELFRPLSLQKYPRRRRVVEKGI
jgi:molybdopterin biosynthesis enzyme MoaB